MVSCFMWFQDVSSELEWCIVGLYHFLSITLLHVAANYIVIWSTCILNHQNPSYIYHAVQKGVATRLAQPFPYTHGMAEVHTFHLFPGVHLGKQHLVLSVKNTRQVQVPNIVKSCYK